MTRYIQSPDTSSILIKPLIHSMRKTLINAVMLESLISPSTVLKPHLSNEKCLPHGLILFKNTYVTL